MSTTPPPPDATSIVASLIPTGSRPEISTYPRPSAALRPPVVAERDLERAMVGFLAKCQPRTQATYRQKLRAFADWLGIDFDELPAALLARGPAGSTIAVEEFRAHLIATLAPRPGQGRGRGDRPAPATVNGYVAPIRSLVDFLRRLHLCQWRLAVEDERVVTYRDTRGPGVEAVRQLRRATSAAPDPRIAMRDAAITALLSDLALRRGELLALNVVDVACDAKGRPTRLHILGKGRLDAEGLTLPPRTAATLQAWLDVRMRLDAAPSGPRDTRALFVSLDPGAARPGRRDPRTGERRARKSFTRLSPQALARRLAVIGHRAGIVAAVTPHQLRHTAITALLEQGKSLRDVQRFARHADPRVTIRYDDNRQDVAGTMAGNLSELFGGDDEKDTGPR